MSSITSKMVTLEERVDTLVRHVRSLADAIRLEGQLNATRFEAVFADFDLIKRKLDALPMALAAMLADARLAVRISRDHHCKPLIEMDQTTQKN